MDDGKGANGTAALREDISGTVLEPGDAGYDEARTLFNAMIDRRPAAIAQCEDPGDVRAALAFARERGLDVAVRSGGHSVAGMSLNDGGLVVDLRRMNAVSVDPEARTATVAGGATWSDVDRATQPHGLATTGGRVSTTGVAGLTLGGGSGWLERKLGLACDSLVSVSLVSADGRQLTAGEDENPELFWALHGGGGNFGVVTSFTFALAPLPQMSIALLLWPQEAGREVAGRFRALAEGAPDEVGGGLIYLTGPPEDFVPKHLVGRLATAALVTHAGPEAELREVIAPLLELEPEGRMITPIPYAELQCMIDDPPGYRNYWTADYLDELPDAALDRFCARAADMVVPSPSQHILFPWGGAVARNAGDWPIAGRGAPWVAHPLGLWESADDDERARRWAHDVRRDLAEWATGGVYLNFIGDDEGDERVVAGYGGRANYDRLAAVKAELDPDNVFRGNHNVRPLAPA